MLLLSIDPGLKGCGAAVWDDSKLVEAEYVNNLGTDWLTMSDALHEWAMGPNKVVIELPQVYVQSKWKGDPNDLIDLAGLVGTIIGRFGVDYVLYKPAAWKGQVPKDIMQKRIEKRLSPKEMEVVLLPAKSLAHNVFDAIGIGLHHLGRL